MSKATSSEHFLLWCPWAFIVAAVVVRGLSFADAGSIAPLSVTRWLVRACLRKISAIPLVGMLASM
jgi:hypothetical protein